MNGIKDFDNTKLSNLSKSELKEYLILLKHYSIKYRDELELVKNMSYGFEIETDMASDYEISRFVNKHFKDYTTSADVTVPFGIEIQTPILHGEPSNWQELQLLTLYLRANSIISDNCGFHIHIGTQVLKNDIDNWLNFISLWSYYEDIIYRFAYGEYISERPNIMGFAPPMAKSYYKIYKNNEFNYSYQIEELVRLMYQEKNNGVNVINAVDFQKESVDNTIEFRMFNGTLNPIIMQNNLNFLNSFIKLCYKNIDRERIMHLIKENTLDNMELYRNINLKKAINFADLLFDKPLDKNNFLRQYFKDFREVKATHMIESKKFTK